MADQMHTFEVQYTDGTVDPWGHAEPSDDAPIFTWRCKAYDAEHAEDKFYSGPDDGFVVVKISKVRS